MSGVKPTKYGRCKCGKVLQAGNVSGLCGKCNVKRCACGKQLRWNNKSGVCNPCYEQSPGRKALQEEYNAQRRVRNKTDREWRERDLAAKKAHYAANREQVLAQVKAHYQENREQILARSKAYWKANPDKRQAHDARHRASARELFVEKVYKSVVWSRDKGICHLCGLPADPLLWHLDHVISQHDLGPHCYDNTAVAHPSCNHTKSRASYSGDEERWALAVAAYKSFHEGGESNP